MSEQEAWVLVDNITTHLGGTKDTVYQRSESRGMPAHLWKPNFSQVNAWMEAGDASADESKEGGLMQADLLRKALQPTEESDDLISDSDEPPVAWARGLPDRVWPVQCLGPAMRRRCMSSAVSENLKQVGHAPLQMYLDRQQHSPIGMTA